MSVVGVQEALNFDEPPPARVPGPPAISGAADRFGDPLCWTWPVPESATFTDDRTAEAFLAWWNRLCAICGWDGPLLKDHDHATLNVRGFLCGSCNTAEGTSRIAGDIFAKYRERNPAGILGIQVRYRIHAGLWRPAPLPAPQRAPEDSTDREAQDLRIALALREARLCAGLSQQAVADAMRERGCENFWQQTVLQIERNKRALYLGEAYALIQVLGLGDSMNDFLAGLAPPAPPVP